MSTQEDWPDFTHTTQSSPLSAHELFQRFREFQRFVAGLSKKELVARHWLKVGEDDSAVTRLFFDLPLPDQRTLFRKSATANEGLLALWEARARSEAEYVCVAEERPTYSGITREDLRKIALASVNPQVIRELPRMLANLGIILVYVYALPGMNADGAVFHLSTGHPVIAMSLRFPRLDYFWFTLLHELAHLVLHTDQLTNPVFFDVEADEKNAAEKAANRLAKDSFVDRNAWRSCEPKYDTSERAVHTFAGQQGVHPAIVAGLLRKESGNFKRYNALIQAHDVRKIIFEP